MQAKAHSSEREITAEFLEQEELRLNSLITAEKEKVATRLHKIFKAEEELKLLPKVTLNDSLIIAGIATRLDPNFGIEDSRSILSNQKVMSKVAFCKD